MEQLTQNRLKKIGIISGLFLFIVFLLWGLSFMNFIGESSLKNAAKKILKESSLSAEYRDVKILGIERPYVNNLGLMPVTFTASDGEKNYRLFFIRLAGKYGLYQGLFLYDEAKGTIFCGLAGVDSEKIPKYYGITDFNTDFWCKKIDSILHKQKNR